MIFFLNKVSYGYKTLNSSIHACALQATMQLHPQLGILTHKLQFHTYFYIGGAGLTFHHRLWLLFHLCHAGFLLFHHTSSSSSLLSSLLFLTLLPSLPALLQGFCSSVTLSYWLKDKQTSTCGNQEEGQWCNLLAARECIPCRHTTPYPHAHLR